MLKIYCILYKFIVLKIQLQKFLNLFYFILLNISIDLAY